MNFVEMLNEVKAGKKARREKHDPNLVFVFTPWPKSEIPRSTLGHITILNISTGEIGTMNSSVEDRNATDWIIVK